MSGSCSSYQVPRGARDAYLVRYRQPDIDFVHHPRIKFMNKETLLRYYKICIDTCVSAVATRL